MLCRACEEAGPLHRNEDTQRRLHQDNGSHVHYCGSAVHYEIWKYCQSTSRVQA